MKKSTFLFTVVLAMALASCGQRNANTSQKNDTNSADTTVSLDETPTSAHYDFLYIEDGGLFFYDLKTHEAMRYEDETDSVVNVLCSKKGALYYSVEKDNGLYLKTLDLKTAGAKPEQLVDWDVDLSEKSSYGVVFGKMYFNYNETQIALERDMKWWAGPLYNLAVYDMATKKVSICELYRMEINDEEIVDVEFLDAKNTFDRWGENIDGDDPMEGMFAYDTYLYYMEGGNRVCLNDKIDYDECVGFALEDCEQYPVSLDPTGKKVLILVEIGMGDGVLGTYLVSSLDGTMQKALEGTDPEGPAPEWLPDGSLLYGCLSLMDPEGNVIQLSKSCDYCVLH